MKKQNVQVGEVYLVKVSGKMAHVKLTAESPHGGWVGKNLTTGKEVRVRSASRLRCKAPNKASGGVDGTAPAKSKLPGKTAKKTSKKTNQQTDGFEVTIPVRTEDCGAASHPAEGCDCLACANARENAARVAPADESAKATQAKKERPTAQRGATGAKRTSLLNAAVQVLEASPTGEPMTCRDMVNLAQVHGMWTPARAGKTPDRTLYSAILREINTKGQASRFEKTARGHFKLTGKN